MNSAELKRSCEFELELAEFELKVFKAQQQNRHYYRKYRINFEGQQMDEKERLYMKIFSDTVVLVSEKSDLELEAFREELAEIIKTAKAQYSAVDHVKRERSSKRKLASGFFTSVQTDDITEEAIHNINERAKKLSKQEKLIENLIKNVGMSREDATKMVSATTVLAIKSKKENETISEVLNIEEVKIPETSPEDRIIKPFSFTFKKD